MNIKEVKDLIQDILRSDINEFELEHTGTRVRLRRGFAQTEITVAPESLPRLKPTAAKGETNPASSAGFTHAALGREETLAEEGLHYITSPIVGTFYRAPAPTADHYVKIGSKVEVGMILCIVEAMKLMNEIPSDVSGEVTEIFVENAQPVEFGQKLFAIRTRK